MDSLNIMIMIIRVTPRAACLRLGVLGSKRLPPAAAPARDTELIMESRAAGPRRVTSHRLRASETQATDHRDCHYHVQAGRAAVTDCHIGEPRKHKPRDRDCHYHVQAGRGIRVRVRRRVTGRMIPGVPGGDGDRDSESGSGSR